MSYVILFDFGSTFTKATVVSIPDKCVVFTCKVPSTVKSDAMVCMNECLALIRQQIGAANVLAAKKIASSSAAGGLRMSVCGLTTSLSIAAGKNVSFGAGAKIVHLCVGELMEADVKEISQKNSEIVLLCGGYEGGNEDVLIKNARTIAFSNLTCPVIFAGNSHVMDRVRLVMAQGGKDFFLARNIIPDVGMLDPDSAEKAIRHLFMQRIVNMKGLNQVRQMVGEILMPTPAAVLSAGELLSKGITGSPGMGELMILDIGGATTDIHSYAQHMPYRGARFVGAAEPYLKRTVEGDLGMRESSDTLCKEAGYTNICAMAEIERQQLENSILQRVAHTDFLPRTTQEQKLDETIAFFAARLAARRHCGKIERTVSSNCNRLQIGKNLSSVSTIIGTGGVIINSSAAFSILRGVLANAASEPDLLLPEKAEIFVDRDYVLYAAGLLRTLDEELAHAVLKNSQKNW